jgi:predicted nucleotidyltransferase
VGGILDERRLQSQRRLEDLKNLLADAQRAADGKACIYATGSFARGEASAHSDLDLFIVGRNKVVKGRSERLLSRLDETCIKADLIRTTRAMRIPEFSGDGEYLSHYTIGDLLKALGTPADDANNTFTARLLLLLESRPLVGSDVYETAIEETVTAYWRDFAGHEKEFMPAFLANDILRLWRTFCVNYEARTKSEPDLQRAKRKLKNYKLKHSRLLTCYSALLFLMGTWIRKKTVTPSDAITMATLTPTHRLEAMRRDRSLRRAHRSLDGLLRRYERFLKETDMPEKALIARLQDPKDGRSMFAGASDFGRQMLNALEVVGKGSDFHRMLVV